MQFFYGMSNKVFETELNLIDFHIIMEVKRLRKRFSYSQRGLSKKMGVTSTFVGKCESLGQPEKYNLRHLIRLKSIFNLRYLDDFFPEGFPDDKHILVRYVKTEREKLDGTLSKIREDTVIEILNITAKKK